MYLNNRKLDAKFFLWILLFLQLFLISVFILFGSLIASQDDGSNGQLSSLFTVKFITNISAEEAYENGDEGQTSSSIGGRINPKFQLIKTKSVVKLENYTKYFRPIHYKGRNNHEHRKLCFIEGTHFRNKTDSNLVMQDDSDSNCSCQPEWHGKDCGQPEVLWRAFMTSKIPLNVSSNFRKIPKKIFYIIQSTYLSVEVLEIQIQELIELVNLFILCDLQPRPSESPDNLIDSRFSIRKHVTNTGFLKAHQDRILFLEDRTCSARNIYRKMKKFINLKDLHHEDDILIFSKTDEILNRKAINYFRWYDNWPQPVRFRLKHNVYGFFWQHPQNTVIGSVASQLNILDEVYKSDPERMLQLEERGTPGGMVVGDLNHYGGWFCEMCYQPIDIVKYLQFLALNISNFSNSYHNQSSASYLPLTNTQIFNEEYVQKLISTGKYLDNKLDLIKIRKHYDQKYFFPSFVRNNSWKFDNIVINLFARWDDNVEDDEYFG